MSRSAVSQPLSPLSNLLAVRYQRLHRELADACGGKGPAIPKSSRRNQQRALKELLSRHMGLALHASVKASDLDPTFSPELVRRQLDERECEGWDHLMRRIESTGHPQLERLERIVRNAQLEQQPGRELRFPDLPLLDPSKPLLPQLELEPAELLEMLGGCEQDLLGTYSPTHGITLYYARIGLCAEALGVDPFHLGMVVYIHELAHLISHQGLDLDGCDWPTYSFNDASTYTVESIAQWYTSLVVAGREEEDAFYALLRGQSEPYTAFRRWRNDPMIREYVRMAMLEIRRCSLPDNQPQGSLFERVRQLVKFSKDYP